MVSCVKEHKSLTRGRSAGMLACSGGLFTGYLFQDCTDEIRVQGHRLMSHSVGRLGEEMQNR